jgi:uncharacterized protein (TIGR04222 family)
MVIARDPAHRLSHRAEAPMTNRFGDDLDPLVAELAEDPVALAMLAGGPARAVDAVVVQLVREGRARADAGMITRTDTDPRPAVLGVSFTVRNGMGVLGSAPIQRVREQACSIGWVFEVVFTDLSRRGLAVSSLRRTWEPAGWSLVPVVPLSATALLLLDDGSRTAAAVTFGTALASILVTAGIVVSRPGHHGQNPTTTLGRAVLDRARAGAESDLVLGVALDGFAAMTDPGFRAAVQGDAADATWTWQRRSTDRTTVDDLARRLVLGDQSSH